MDALGGLFPESSRTTLRQMLQTGRVRVNGAVEKNSKRELRRGDTIDLARRMANQFLPEELSVLHEDDDVIVVVKAAGLLTVATESEQEETAQAFLNAYLKARRETGRVHVVHRLDRATSGVLVFAKHFAAKEHLKELFARHAIERVYVAIVEGNLSPGKGTIRSFLAEDRNLKVGSVNDARKGKLAVTHYSTIQTGKRFSMLEVKLETGRRNQIRVHLSEKAHPVIGDDAYGSSVDPIGRLGLHARVLGFVHPRTKKTMIFEAPLPDSFTKLEL